MNRPSRPPFAWRCRGHVRVVYGIFVGLIVVSLLVLPPVSQNRITYYRPTAKTSLPALELTPPDPEQFCRSSDDPTLPPTLLQYGLPPVRNVVPIMVAAPNCTNWGFKQRKYPALILDGFTFNGEYDVLMLRLFELEGVVDEFILVEAAKTFTNTQKPLFFKQRKHLFSRWLDTILHVTIAEWKLPFWRESPWCHEQEQRDVIMDGFNEAIKRRGGLVANKDTVVIVSDVDEIPSTDVVRALKHCEMPTWPIHMYLHFWSNYALKWRKVNGQPLKNGLSATTITHLMQFAGPNEFRSRSRNLIPIPPFDRGGYHLGFYMCPQQMLEKLRSYSHTEYNTPEVATIAHMTSVWRNGKDWIPGRPWEDCEPYNTSVVNATIPAIANVAGNRDYFIPYLL